MMNQTVASDSASPISQPDRRTLLRTTGLAAAGIAALASIAPATVLADTPRTINGVTALYFTLFIKYVTANYYLYAATGTGLAPEDTGYINNSSPPPTSIPGQTVLGGSAVPFKTPIYAQYANNIAADELTHLRYFRAVLAETDFVYAMPTIDMGSVWTNLGVAAGLIVSGQTFNPFADEISFLLGAYYLEDLCVSFFSGVFNGVQPLPLSTNFKELYGALAGAEAYHAGTIRTLLALIGGGGAVAKLSAYRASLSGVADPGILMPNGAVNVGPFGSQALMLTRDAYQAMSVLFLAPTQTGFFNQSGFFPNGLLMPNEPNAH
jgi:hypothetical protein